MSPTHFKVKSLSGKIFTSVLAFTLAVIVALSVTMTTIYYLSYEHDAETELAASAQDAARYLNATPSSENAPALKEQFSGLTRYTLIDADGTVLFDSAPTPMPWTTTPTAPRCRKRQTWARPSPCATLKRWAPTPCMRR